jgi:hypothetical protein
MEAINGTDNASANEQRLAFESDVRTRLSYFRIKLSGGQHSI